MTNTDPKPYVHVPVDAVDVVVFDPDGRLDPERFDRYPTFDDARNAALCCIEAMLDEGDYDDETHRVELERMRGVLEPAPTFEDLLDQPFYGWYLDHLSPAGTAA